MQQKIVVVSPDELRTEFPNTEKVMYYKGRTLVYKYNENVVADELIFDIYFKVKSSILPGGWILVGGARVFSIYVSEDGDDTNDGLTPSTPIRSTEGLKKYLGYNLSAPDSILILEGDTTTPDFVDERNIAYKNFYVLDDIKVMYLSAKNVHFLFKQTWQTTDYSQFDSLPPISDVKIVAAFDISLENCVFDCYPNQSFFGQNANQSVLPKDRNSTPLFKCNNFEWKGNGVQYLCFFSKGKYTRLIAETKNALVQNMAINGEMSGYFVAMFNAEKVDLNISSFSGYFTKYANKRLLRISYSTDTNNDIITRYGYFDLYYADNVYAKGIENDIFDVDSYVMYVPTNYLKWNGPVDDVWNAVRTNFPRAYLRFGNSVWKVSNTVVYKDITIPANKSTSFTTFGSVIDIKEIVVSPSTTDLVMNVLSLTTNIIDTWTTPIYRIVIPQNASYDYQFVIELADDNLFADNLIQIVVPTGYYQQSQPYNGTNAMSSANQYDITYGVLYALFGAIIPNHTRRYLRLRIVSSISLPPSDFIIATAYHLDRLIEPNDIIIIDRGNRLFPATLTFREYQIININTTQDKTVRITLLP